MTSIIVLGSGGWGTAVALMALRQGMSVTLWSRRPQHVEEMRRDRENRAYLPGIPLPGSLELSSDPADLARSPNIVCAVPTQHVRAVVSSVQSRLTSGLRVLSLSKGIENGTLSRPSQILSELLPGARVTVLSGPSHAEEVARGLPATVVAAATDEEEARFWQQGFTGSSLRLYTSVDPLGVELAGALKNVIAIAAGICDGLSLGDNAKAALLSRGLVEMARLGEKMGARKSTFFGISGVGDLVATCCSAHGRNLRVGRAIGSGKTPAQALEGMRMVAEGVWTSTAARDVGKRHGIEMPITEEVCRILHEGKAPLDGLKSLMARQPRSESADLGSL